ncbi:MAG: DUF5106 domain-containing protein [Duncaniella sp.]|nr:DUF5106 domain-containing protein [Duncaniella sp.]
MNTKVLIVSLMMVLSGWLGAKADTYFQYPIVPDSITTFQARCDYLADHFFDFCDFSRSFSNRQRMGEEIKVYLTLISNANARKGAEGARALMKKLEKQPAEQLYVAELAEGSLYGDTAQYWLDHIYLPFAEAIAANKRIGKAEKSRYEHQAKLLRNSTVGGQVPDMPYTKADGTTSHIKADTAQVVLIFFNDPGCSDCFMARVRLNADISISDLIREGKLKVVSISLCDPDDEWKKYASELPETWTTGAAPDADLTFDLRSGTPDFYILDSRHRIWYKHLDIDQVLDVARQLKKR